MEDKKVVHLLQYEVLPGLKIYNINIQYITNFRRVALTPSFPSECCESLSSCDTGSESICLPQNRSIEDAISNALRTTLTHLDCQNIYVRMLFIDFSSAFITVNSSKLIPSSVSLESAYLQVNSGLFNYSVKLVTDMPQGWLLSPFLCSSCPNQVCR